MKRNGLQPLVPLPVHAMERSRREDSGDDGGLGAGHWSPDGSHGAGRTLSKRARPARIRIDGQEKIEAGAQSAQAMATHMMAMGQPWSALAFRHYLRSSAALMSLARSRTPGQLIARQAALARALGQSAVSMADVSKSVTRLAHRGLKPIHAKATANARRLGKR